MGKYRILQYKGEDASTIFEAETCKEIIEKMKEMNLSPKEIEILEVPYKVKWGKTFFENEMEE